ncbi:MAG: LamG domain-containing protein [archaeon]
MIARATKKRFYKKNVKAQAAIETMMILAIAMIGLTIFVGIVWTQINDQFIFQQQQIGSEAIRTLANEVDDAYFLGFGSTKEVIIVLPDLIDFEKSVMENRTFILNVNGTDLIASTKVDIRGEWPDNSGTYVFTLTSFGDFVAVSVNLLSFDPTQINESLNQGTTKEVTLDITNIQPNSKNYNFSIDFSNLNVSITSVEEGLISFNANDVNSIDLVITCELNSAGKYYGALVFEGDVNVTYPVNINCLSGQTKLVMLPRDLNVSLASGATTTEKFLLCNNSIIDLTNISAQVTGAIKSNAFARAPSSITANTCSDLNVFFNGLTTDTNLSGALTVTTSGLSESSSLFLRYLAVVESGVCNFYNYANTAPIANYNLSSFVKQNDQNNWVATGELDWNLESRNDTTSGGWGELVNDFNIRPENLVGLWHLNGDANDSSGNGNHGTFDDNNYSNGLWNKQAGQFDGINDDVTFNINPTYESNSRGTISLWAMTPNIGGGVFSYGSNGNTDNWLLLNYVSTGEFRFHIRDGSTNDDYYKTTNNVFSDNKWHHFVVTNDGIIRIYVDGKLEPTTTTSDGGGGADGDWFEDIASQASLAGIGFLNRDTSSSTYFTGNIDEVAIWDTALNPEEIKLLYEEQKGQWLDTNLVAYYKFDENIGTRVFDSARGYNGTLVATANINAKGMWDSNALDLDGDSDYVSYSLYPEYRYNSQGTISAWIKLGVTNAYQTIYTLGDNGSTNNYLVFQSSTDTGKLSVNVNISGTSNRIDTLQTLNVGEWYYVAVTSNGVNDTNLYINGVTVPITIFSGVEGKWFDDISGTAEFPCIGALCRSSIASYHNGLIDEVKIWDRVLNATEILADYNNFLNAKFVDNNIIDAGASADWNQIKINSNEYFSFGKEMESNVDGTATFGELQESNVLFDENLVDLWHLNNNLDDSKNSYNGTWSISGIESYVDGLFNSNVADLDGSTDYITMGDIPEIDSTQYLSVSMWVKGDAFSDYDGLFQKYLSGTERFTLQLGSGVNNDNPYVTINGSAVYSNQTNFFVVDQWKHLVVVYDGTQSINSNKIRFYEDGVLVTNVGSISTIPVTLNDLSGGQTVIGNDIHSTGRFFDGKIEEVAIWNKALSEDEVNNLYESQAGKFYGLNLVGLWHLNGNANDSSGNGNNGNFVDNNYSTGLWDTFAGQFDGVNDVITTNLVPSLSGKNTISVWFKTSVPSTNQIIVGSQQSTGSTYRAYIGINNGKLAGGVGTTSWSTIIGTTPIQADTWYHGVIEWSGTPSLVKLYLNGVGEYLGTKPSPVSDLNFYVGANNYGGTASTFFNGKIEEVSIWDNVLTSDEVLDLYRKGVSKLDLNIYSCSDESCNTKTSSQLITDVNNNSWMNLTISDSNYLGWEAIFGKATGFEDYNAGSFFVNAYVKDVNISYSS